MMSLILKCWRKHTKKNRSRLFLFVRHFEFHSLLFLELFWLVDNITVDVIGQSTSILDEVGLPSQAQFLYIGLPVVRSKWPTFYGKFALLVFCKWGSEFIKITKPIIITLISRTSFLILWLNTCKKLTKWYIFAKFIEKISSHWE